MKNYNILKVINVFIMWVNKKVRNIFSVYRESLSSENGGSN